MLGIWSDSFRTAARMADGWANDAWDGGYDWPRRGKPAPAAERAWPRDWRARVDQAISRR